ncbi:MAG: hypothetical protein RXO43_02240 [Candidatus Micrarchaeota archaeon]
MGGNRISLFLSIALFALLSIGIANAAGLSITSNPITTPIDYPQNAIYTISGISGGVPPYTFNAYYTNTNALATNVFLGSNTFSPGPTYNAIVITINSISTNSISITAYNGIVSTANILFSNTISTGTANTIYGAWIFNAFFADSTGASANTISSSNTLTIDPTPTATLLTPSNTMLDSGQYVTYNVIINGGTLPITANLIYVFGPSRDALINDNAPGDVLQTITLPAGSAEPNTITFNSFELTTPGPYIFNVVAVDSANTPVTFNAVANTITVNPILSVSISPTSNTLDASQVLPLATVVTGGTPPFSITYSLSNDLCGSLSAPSNTLSADGTNTIVFSPNTAITSACTANIMVSVTDSATTNSIVSANSVITVYPTPTITLSATPSNSIMYGSPFTINAVISGGTGNFAVYWYLNGNLITPTIVSPNTITSNTMILPAAGSYAYMVEANDIGTSSVYTLAPATNTIIVAKNNTLSASSSGNPGSSYYSYPVTITFTGTPTIHHQAKWSLYVNGALYGTTNSTLTYYEEFAPPGAYNFVFNLTSDANYTPYTYTTSLLISYPPTGASGVTTTVTTVTTTSTTTSIPTTSVTTTIPPSQKAINITANISSSSPLVLSLPNTHSVLSIYTTSAASAPIAAHIANVTQQVSSFAKPQPNYTLINAVNVSIKTTAPITAFFVEHYPCSIPGDLVAPYIFKNNTWLAITNYTVNATTCTVSFNIPSDPIVAIFEKSMPTTTTTSIATTIPTTTPTTIYYPSPSPKPSSSLVIEPLILIIIVIIIILVLLYYYKLLHRRYHGFKR